MYKDADAILLHKGKDPAYEDLKHSHETKNNDLVSRAAFLQNTPTESPALDLEEEGTEYVLFGWLSGMNFLI